MTAESMYLKDPDWDVHVASGPRRTERINMWSEAIDGEYLHVREDGELCVDGAGGPGGKPVSKLQIVAELPDGEYRLVFQGGRIEDDWEAWSHKFARQLRADGRGQVEVRLLAAVDCGAVAFSIESPNTPEVPR